MDLVNCSVDSFQYARSDQHPDRREVSEISKNKILSIIRNTTGSPLEEIQHKSQLNYLFDYLASDHIAAKTVVAEQEYVDKHYLEDYAEYYSRCFSNHRRKCTRLHFFSFEFDEAEFLDALDNGESELRQSLESEYQGYCVIRPLAETFLGKISIAPYKHLLLDPKQYKIIKRPEEVSLFGIPLRVDTAAMREQDKVVSACATSAIWSVLNANAHLSKDQMPSLSSITRVAAKVNPEQDRLFPNIGLLPESASACLNHYGLESISIQLKDISDPTALKKWLHAYLNADIPLLLGGEIYRKKQDSDDFVLLGQHFVCALGYQMDAPTEGLKEEKGIQYAADKIRKCYIHDDRYGQYTAMRLDEPEKVSRENQQHTEARKADNTQRKIGFRLSNYQGHKEVLVPSLIIIGLYHKIRLNYIDISEVCECFYAFASAISQHIRNNNTYTKKADEIAEAFRCFLRGKFAITLTTNNKLKEELVATENWHSSSFGVKKSDTLIKSLPRFLWLIRIENEDGEAFSDLLFDATEIFQGDIFIGYISYSRASEKMWIAIGDYISDNFWDQLAKEMAKSSRKLGSDFNPSPASSIKKYFQNVDNRYTTLFGICRPPKRNLHPAELNEHRQVVRQHPVFLISDTEVENWPMLNNKVKYIWVVNSFGHLVIGHDIEEISDKSEFPRKEGHPTLVNFEPARVGGELEYCEKEGAWTINTRSGTYSRHLQTLKDQKDILLNVIEFRFKNFPHGKIIPRTKKYQDEVITQGQGTS